MNVKLDFEVTEEMLTKMTERVYDGDPVAAVVYEVIDEELDYNLDVMYCLSDESREEVENEVIERALQTEDEWEDWCAAEEENDDDEEEADGEVITTKEAFRLLDFAATIYCWASEVNDDEVDEDFHDKVNQFARDMFTKFCEQEGIVGVSEEEEE